MNRFLAIFWLFIALCLLILPEFFPDLKQQELMQNNVALAGFCFALAAYNMIRWRLIKNRQLELERAREERLQRRDAYRAIDPNFDFSDSIQNKDDRPKREGEAPGEP